MTKGVLGNDPFQRGAAPRTGDAQEDKAEAKAAKKAPASKSAKGGAGKSAKSAGKARSAKEAPRTKAPKAGKGRSPEAKPAAKAPKTPAAAVHKFEARANPRGGTSASPQEHEDTTAKAAHATREAPAGKQGPPPARASAQAPSGDEP
ncbi:hypothetical protein D7X75_29200, partial [Corallococcus sp. CA031C]